MPSSPGSSAGVSQFSGLSRSARAILLSVAFALLGEMTGTAAASTAWTALAYAALGSGLRWKAFSQASAIRVPAFVALAVACERAVGPRRLRASAALAVGWCGRARRRNRPGAGCAPTGQAAPEVPGRRDGSGAACPQDSRRFVVLLDAFGWRRLPRAVVNGGRRKPLRLQAFSLLWRGRPDGWSRGRLKPRGIEVKERQECQATAKAAA